MKQVKSNQELQRTLIYRAETVRNKHLRCPNCGSKDISNNEFSPEEKPYVIRIEHTCNKCKFYWYEED